MKLSTLCIVILTVVIGASAWAADTCDSPLASPFNGDAIHSVCDSVGDVACLEPSRLKVSFLTPSFAQESPVGFCVDDSTKSNNDIDVPPSTPVPGVVSAQFDDGVNVTFEVPKPSPFEALPSVKTHDFCDTEFDVPEGYYKPQFIFSIAENSSSTNSTGPILRNASNALFSTSTAASAVHEATISSFADYMTSLSTAAIVKLDPILDIVPELTFISTAEWNILQGSSIVESAQQYCLDFVAAAREISDLLADEASQVMESSLSSSTSKLLAAKYAVHSFTESAFDAIKQMTAIVSDAIKRMTTIPSKKPGNVPQLPSPADSSTTSDSSSLAIVKAPATNAGTRIAARISTLFEKANTPSLFVGIATITTAYVIDWGVLPTLMADVGTVLWRAAIASKDKIAEIPYFIGDYLAARPTQDTPHDIQLVGRLGRRMLEGMQANLPSFYGAAADVGNDLKLAIQQTNWVSDRGTNFFASILGVATDLYGYYIAAQTSGVHTATHCKTTITTVTATIGNGVVNQAKAFGDAILFICGKMLALILFIAGKIVTAAFLLVAFLCALFGRFFPTTPDPAGTAPDDNDDGGDDGPPRSDRRRRTEDQEDPEGNDDRNARSSALAPTTLGRRRTRDSTDSPPARMTSSRLFEGRGRASRVEAVEESAERIQARTQGVRRNLLMTLDLTTDQNEIRMEEEVEEEAVAMDQDEDDAVDMDQDNADEDDAEEMDVDDATAPSPIREVRYLTDTLSPKFVPNGAKRHRTE